MVRKIWEDVPADEEGDEAQPAGHELAAEPVAEQVLVEGHGERHRERPVREQHLPPGRHEAFGGAVGRALPGDVLWPVGYQTGRMSSRASDVIARRWFPSGLITTISRPDA